jgi:alkaline phosphatase D
MKRYRVFSRWNSMANLTIQLLLAAALLLGVRPQQQPAEPLRRIAFGSCNRQDRPQPLWKLIAKQEPQLWIWLGDNVYGDSEDVSVLRAKYVQQQRNPEYRDFVRKVPIVGTWDDHDFGKNNGGREFTARRASQAALLDFLGEPAQSPRRDQRGVYASYTYGPVGKQIKVILLDTRYHRDAIGSNGTILGEAQWQWLERELRSSKAQIHLIGSGIQVLPEQHRFEKWADFPAERERLFKLIGQTKASGVIFLSGDRHIAELSRVRTPHVRYPLFDLTSSGLTHTWSSLRREANWHRVGDLVIALNYGTIDVDWEAADPRITMRVLDDKNAVRIQHALRLSELAATRSSNR